MPPLSIRFSFLIFKKLSLWSGRFLLFCSLNFLCCHPRKSAGKRAHVFNLLLFLVNLVQQDSFFKPRVTFKHCSYWVIASFLTPPLVIPPSPDMFRRVLLSDLERPGVLTSHNPEQSTLNNNYQVKLNNRSIYPPISLKHVIISECI